MPEPLRAASDHAFWNEVEGVFSAAVELGDGQRRALLDAQCAGRAALRAEVESLLAVHSRAQGFMRHPTMAADPVGAPTLREGDVVGQFRLVELIASGGMGTVYRAERADAAFEQQVAVKIISAPITREEVQRRFLAERQILASLHHPHIVGLLDAGLTDGGQAYLIMEFVDGAPITMYCRARALSIGERLRLLRQVCDAVQYAHAHFVVHSDLKPANVLVTSDGIPKVLDFGIATLLQGPLAGAENRSAQRGSDPLTPNYASPEQLEGAGVTIASDVFGLGMLMFEVLTGTRPYDVAGKRLDEVLRIVTETPTQRPSDADPESNVRPPYDWRRALRGDLDAIAVRACHRAPERRYASADALSQDIGRYLNGIPVEARKPTFPYIAGKLAARHRIAFASVAMSAVLVVAALGIAVWQARVATVERERADRRFNEVRQLANTVIFDLHDAVAPLAGSTPVRQKIVTEGLQYLERLTADSSGDRQLQLELGRAYLKIGQVQGRPNTPNLGDRDGAINSFRRAKALLAPLATGTNTPADVFSGYLDSMRFLSETLGLMGESHHGEAIAEAREAVATAERFLSAHPTVEQAHSFVASANFAIAIRLGWPESQPYWAKAGAEYEALLASSPDNPAWQRNAALVEKYVGSFFEGNEPGAAFPHYQRALELDQKRFDHAPTDRVVQFDVGVDLSNLAYVQWRRKDLTNAIALYTRCLEIRERLLATDPKDSLSREKLAVVYKQLGNVYQDKGEPKMALDHYRLAIERLNQLSSLSPPSREDLAESWAGLADVTATLGETSQSCDAFRRAFITYRSLTPAERRIKHDGDDPMPEVARSAAGCGLLDAVQWVRAESNR
jgi:non-specific serine/threonine protein kinase/serine/threonine-protein kinase